MLYLLHGADTYRSRKKLHEIVAAYRAKAGSDLNVVWVDAQEQEPDSLHALAGMLSLFGGAKLGIVEHPFTGRWEFARLRSILERGRDSRGITLVLWERELAGQAERDAREAKDLIGKSQEFAPLAGAQLIRWIRMEAETRGITLSPRETDEIALSVSDSWGVVNALEKRAVGSISRPPTRFAKASARRVTNPLRQSFSEASHQPPTIFSLGDSFFTSPAHCLSLVSRLIHAGEDPGRLFAYAAGYVRAVALVQAFADERVPLPKLFLIHPFVIKKASIHGRMISPEDISLLIKRLFEGEYKIKTGITNPREALENILVFNQERLRSRRAA